MRLREKLKDEVKSIKVVTIGPAKAAETLRTALAMGADSGIHVELPDNAPPPEPLGVAKALRALIEKQKEGGTVRQSAPAKAASGRRSTSATPKPPSTSRKSSKPRTNKPKKK